MMVGRVRILLAIVIGVFSIGIYYALFCPFLEVDDQKVILPYNFPDHAIYASVMSDIDRSEWGVIITSNYGIGMLYNGLMSILSLVSFDDLPLVTLLVNCTLYVLTVVMFSRICRSFEIGGWWPICLAMFPPFLFFGAFINKEIFLFPLLLATVTAAHQKNGRALVVLTAAFLLVRAQYALIPAIVVFLSGERFLVRALVTYCIMSILSAIIARDLNIFEERIFHEDTSGTGVTHLVNALNREYLIGSLLLNPLRVVHYVLSLGQAWLNIERDGAVNLMKIFQGIAFLWFLAMSPFILRFILMYQSHWRDFRYRIIRACLVAFLLVLLLTAITEPRYLIPAFPLFMLAAGFAASLSGRSNGKVQEELSPGQSAPTCALPNDSNALSLPSVLR